MFENRDSSARERYVIGGYEIRETIGAGGMGVVYRAYDSALEREIALKVLRDDFRAHQAIVARFQREAEAFAKLSHPNIVAVYGVGISAGIPFIAMEYIDGQPLNQLLQARRALPWRDALTLVRQVADALDCAHASGIIHRDIKPANILVTAAGKAFVTDFGIAKVLSAATQLTMEGSRLGTPQYMCPERCQNLPVTPSSDLFSLGVLLFQCLSGQLPFTDPTAAGLLQKIAAQPAPRLGDVVAGIPEPVEMLVAWLLEKNPRQRPANARDLCQAIHRILAGKGIEDASATLEALTELRAALPTPTPWPTPPPARAARKSSLWFSLSRRTRLAVAALLTLATLTGAGLGARQVLQRPVPLVSEADTIAAWTTPPPLFAYADESPGVMLYRSLLPGFEIDSVQPAAGAAFDLVLRGQRDTTRAGEWAAMRLEPGFKTGGITAPPARLTGSLAALGRDTGHVLLATSDGVFEAALSSPDRWTRLTGGTPLAMEARGDKVFLMMANADGVPQLVQAAANTLAVVKVLVDSGVLALYPSGAAQLIYTTGTPGGTVQIFALAVSDTAAPPALLREGQITLGRRPVADDGVSLACVTEAGSLEITRPDAPALSLGEAKEASWISGTQDLLFLRPDRAGRDQVWRVTPGHGEPEQLTFLDSGLRPPLHLSADGAHAVASTPDPQTLVIASLR